MNSTQEIIAAATHADPLLVPVLERIMREDIYHGTLDWQTREELEKAAREALEIYSADHKFFDADMAYRTAKWSRILAERDEQSQNSSVSLLALKAAKAAEEKAEELLRSFSIVHV